MQTENLARNATSGRLIEVAEHLLSAVPEPRSLFGSGGNLESAVKMFLRHGGEDHRRMLVAALARVARQRGLVEGDTPFVWSEEDCTNVLDEQQCSEMCERLLS